MMKKLFLFVSSFLINLGISAQFNEDFNNVTLPNYIWTHATAVNANGQFTTTYYVIWTLGGGTLGLSGKIASGQGFFAETNDNNPDFPITGNIEFNKSMRVTTGIMTLETLLNIKKFGLI